MRGEVADSAPDTSIPRNPNQEIAPLSFTQQRLWFLHQLQPDSAAYNIPLAFMLEGALDETALVASLNALVARHAALRTSFPLNGTEPQQHVAPTLTLPLTVHDLHALPPSDRDRAAHDLLHASATQPFDLATAPLLRGLLLRLAPDRHLFALTLHHSICDEWSLAIFLRELGALYGAFPTHTPSPLPPLPIQYTDFTHWQRAQ
ncbi:MAG TPA: condensation domain-containing protein, partial [Herpetosiphonaceae bacterium]